MELVVRKNDLLRELQLFQGIVERKNTIPILANVLMEAAGDEVRFLATDLEVGLRSRCAASVAKGGALTLPAKKLYEIIKALPETDVRIEEDKGGVKVAADRFDSRMQTLPREDYPAVPEASGAGSATLTPPLSSSIRTSVSGSALMISYSFFAGSVREPLFDTVAVHLLRSPTSRSVASIFTSVPLASSSTLARIGIVFLRSTMP